MIKTLLKHKIFEIAIDAMFDKLTDNFNNNTKKVKLYLYRLYADDTYGTTDRKIVSLKKLNYNWYTYIGYTEIPYTTGEDCLKNIYYYRDSHM